MALFLYNTLTRQKEEFKTIEKNKVKIYACGVTVYDGAHIGHARAMFSLDVIRRYLKYKGFQTISVRNITDVDDKIIKRAQEELGLNPSLNIVSATKKITERYIQSFHQDMNDIGVEPPDIEPKATDHIGQMQELIKKLIQNSFAYVKEGDVYFRVKKFSNYGKLSNQSIEKMQGDARIELSEKKENPLDFALWKASKPDEPYWESPWGKGRPGWHIECSAMAMYYLGEHFDIHTGGLDLVFPHHENEIAQSESATGKPFATYWLHNGMVTINGEKMSKSLGNIVLISDVLKKYSADTIKIFFLQAHYSSPLDYSENKMQGAASALERIKVFFDRVEKLPKDRTKKSALLPDEMDLLIKQADVFTLSVEECKIKFEKAMDDNFNTARALSVIFEFISRSNRLLDDMLIPVDRKINMLRCLRFFITQMGKMLGLFVTPEKEKQSLDEQTILQLIQERNHARTEKKYNQADEIREKLYESGIILEDTKDGTIWRRR